LQEPRSAGFGKWLASYFLCYSTLLLTLCLQSLGSLGLGCIMTYRKKEAKS